MASPAADSLGNFNFKVVLLGEGCVGKTSVVLRYVEDKFNERHITTLQVRLPFCPVRLLLIRKLAVINLFSRECMLWGCS